VTQQNEETRTDCMITTGTEVVFAPSPKWEWDVFGGGVMVVQTPMDPPLWRRILTRVFLGSRWKRLNQ